ncbi:unnamed protein product [Rotaria sp. Silwood2]|nr:unnamed protein product [Rotaria sp. Silwood2]
MAERCINFNPSVFKPNICRDCFLNKQYHQNSVTPNENSLSAVQKPTCHETTDSNNKCSQNEIATNSQPVSVQTSSQTMLSHCKYGLSCDRTNPNHFDRYSHPPGFKRQKKPSEIGDVGIPTVSNDSSSSMESTCSLATERELKLKKQLEEQKKSELHFIELVQNKVESLIAHLQLKEEEVVKLRQDLNKMVTYNQQLEIALGEEIDHREQRELERKQILTIPRQTPVYWGLNAFEEPYREIEVSARSLEFDIIQQLLNSTISKHDNQYGTVNGHDPTEFLINRIDMIIRQNNDQLANCGSSIYLEAYPILTPLLDTRTNEYWLFHGCSQNNLCHLLHSGYDPRVSNIKGRFGGGFYLTENSSKSSRYIPCPGCGQNSIGTTSGCSCINQEDLEFSMVLYRAALGDVHVVLKYKREKYRCGPNRQLIRRPPKKTHGKELYDSVMGESMENGGDRLKHREFILYDTGQAYPEYVIYFRRSAKNTLQRSNIEDLKKKCQNLLVNAL